MYIVYDKEKHYLLYFNLVIVVDTDQIIIDYN